MFFNCCACLQLILVDTRKHESDPWSLPVLDSKEEEEIRYFIDDYFFHNLYFDDEVGVWQRTGARWVGRQWSWRLQWWLRNQDSDHLSWFLLFINGVMESSCCNRCNKRIFNALWEWHYSFLTFLTKLQKEIQSNFEGIVQWALCIVVSQVKEDRTVTVMMGGQLTQVGWYRGQEMSESRPQQWSSGLVTMTQYRHWNIHHQLATAPVSVTHTQHSFLLPLNIKTMI